MHDFEYAKQSAIVSTASKPCQGRGLHDTVSGAETQWEQIQTNQEQRSKKQVVLPYTDVSRLANRLLLTRQGMLKLSCSSFVWGVGPWPNPVTERGFSPIHSGQKIQSWIHFWNYGPIYHYSSWRKAYGIVDSFNKQATSQSIHQQSLVGQSRHT